MILAIDQGTTGTTCLLVDEELSMRGRGYAELPQHYPQPGWVEHEPEEIWQTVLAAAEQALTETPTAIGITNQRETTLLWDRGTRRARRTTRSSGRTGARPSAARSCRPTLIRERTGLVPDPYFSATKLEWLLREHDARGPRLRHRRYVALWKLTGGRVHATDETNASRTLLCSLDTLDWDDELLELFSVPRELLPEIKPSGSHFGEAELLGHTLPVQGIAGDQQAALFAVGRREGDVRHRLVHPRRDRGARRAKASCARRRHALETSRHGMPSKARSSRPAPRSSGCATGSA